MCAAVSMKIYQRLLLAGIPTRLELFQLLLCSGDVGCVQLPMQHAAGCLNNCSSRTAAPMYNVVSMHIGQHPQQLLHQLDCHKMFCIFFRVTDGVIEDVTFASILLNCSKSSNG